jgi:hypothetical protein
MRMLSGFDRLSTEEELHQVLAVLNEFAGNGWMLPQEDSTDPQATTLWADDVLDDSTCAESLAELIANRPELKN